jgi:hypothetical protein
VLGVADRLGDDLQRRVRPADLLPLRVGADDGQVEQGGDVLVLGVLEPGQNHAGPHPERSQRMRQYNGFG